MSCSFKAPMDPFQVQHQSLENVAGLWECAVAESHSSPKRQSKFPNELHTSPELTHLAPPHHNQPPLASCSHSIAALHFPETRLLSPQAIASLLPYVVRERR
jgi:hypothetical protein